MEKKKIARDTLCLYPLFFESLCILNSLSSDHVCTNYSLATWLEKIGATWQYLLPNIIENHATAKSANWSLVFSSCALNSTKKISYKLSF